MTMAELCITGGCCERLLPSIGMLRVIRLLALMVGIATTCAARATALSESDLGSEIHSFGERFCIDCHGPEDSQGSFRFDDPISEHISRDQERVWTRALDRVVAGQMPPSEAPQPELAERREFQQRLAGSLNAASLARQRREGRVTLRRLNRRQYQYTLQDLLGHQVEVMDLLPDDSVAAGFDNVGDVLDVSAVHLLRYQEAAEKAIRSVLPARQPKGMNVLKTGREFLESNPTAKGQLGRSLQLDGDALIVYARSGNRPAFTSPRVAEAGRYRVRAMLTSAGTDGRQLPLMITHSGYMNPEDRLQRRVIDLPPERTVIINEEFDLQVGEVVGFTGWDLPPAGNSRNWEDSTEAKPLLGPRVSVDWLEIFGPIDPFPSLGYMRLFGEVPLRRTSFRDAGSLAPYSESPKSDAERLIRSLLPIAFRRPVDEELANYFVGIAHDRIDSGDSFLEAMVAAYTTLLCSPHYLYLIESPPDPDVANDRLDDYAIAARLSYFLWGSMPDEELVRLASDGVLSQPATMEQQVERMLRDPKSKRFARTFTDQWLDLQEIDATTPDPTVYAEFDEFLFWSMPRETLSFFEEVLTNDLPVTEFVDSDWTYLNQRLAQHYGVSGVDGGVLRKCSLPNGSHRGGVITQAAVLKVTADGSRTSPVLRGSWVLNRILGQPADPPPPNTPAIEPDTRGATTIRQQLDKHRSTASCNACHQYIDPPGFALETFDAIGGWREFYRGKGGTRVQLDNYPSLTVSRGVDVERGGQTADGKAFHGIDDYREILLADKDQIARGLLTKLIVHATGGELQFADRQLVDELLSELRKEDYGFRSMIHAVVQSRVFLCK